MQTVLGIAVYNAAALDGLEALLQNTEIVQAKRAVSTLQLKVYLAYLHIFKQTGFSMFFFVSGLLMAVAWLYSIVRLVRPAQLPVPVFFCISAVLLLCAEKMLILRLFSVWGPAQIPVAVHVLAGIGQVLVILLFVCTLLWDMGTGAHWLYARLRGKRFQSLLSHYKARIVCCLALCLTGYGAWAALKVPEVRELTLPVQKLAAPLEKLRIVQLSDLHMGSGFSVDWVRGLVRKVNALQPDLIVITGDLVDGSPESLQDYTAALEQLYAPLGVYIVPGNHEYYSGLARWLPAFRKMGFHVLMNEHRVLSLQQTPFVLLGVTDSGADRFDEDPPNIQAAMRGLPASAQNALRILLAHQPVFVGQATEDPAYAPDVQLSGHTHGGSTFFMQPIVASLNAGYSAGIYAVRDCILYVHSGSGIWGGFPLRLGVPSEITLIRFVSEPKTSTR